METKNSSAKMMMRADEQILWSGKEVYRIVQKRSLADMRLPFAAVWGGIMTVLFGVVTLSGGFGPALLLFYLLLMIPVGLCVLRIAAVRSTARNTVYAVTTEGIYIQKGVTGSEETVFLDYGALVRAEPEDSGFGATENVGDVRCVYLVQTGAPAHDEIMLRNIPDPASVAQMILAQAAEWSARVQDDI